MKSQISAFYLKESLASSLKKAQQERKSIEARK